MNKKLQARLDTLIFKKNGLMDDLFRLERAPVANYEQIFQVALAAAKLEIKLLDIYFKINDRLLTQITSMSASSCLLTASRAYAKLKNNGELHTKFHNALKQLDG